MVTRLSGILPAKKILIFPPHSRAIPAIQASAIPRGPLPVRWALLLRYQVAIARQPLGQGLGGDFLLAVGSEALELPFR